MLILWYLSFQEDKQSSSAAEGEDIKPSVELKPNLLWHAYFNILGQGVDSNKLPQNVFVINGPGDELGFDSAINEVILLFCLY